ncbi:SRPBCC domain-containing protein [Gordonia otitidis]|uniref:SRPBCC family protein n=1 Tax=Gordonia otitidis TaxID=249058 RepID=UPI001D153D22|nr:SRPBCC domain-containing protein [Gordonia otitidis]UEA60643.1 SRPBCC domain-containing protein [Gordonia otitidis]
MPVIDVTKDLDDRSLTITAEFAAPVERIWQIYADPRQLEKIWGPPEYPATFVDHELSPGGRVTYYMTGPEGEKYAGYWLVDSVDEPNSFTFRDGFANEDFTPIESLPLSHNAYSFVEKDTRTVATYVSTYETLEALEKVIEMGVEEGATQSINQIDEFLTS